jgi:hypothetical protein
MTVHSWADRRNPAAPRAVIQRGECERQQCGQYSISISNRQMGLTIRFDTEAEFAHFLATGQTEAPEGDLKLSNEFPGTIGSASPSDGTHT